MKKAKRKKLVNSRLPSTGRCVVLRRLPVRPRACTVRLSTPGKTTKSSQKNRNQNRLRRSIVFTSISMFSEFRKDENLLDLPSMHCSGASAFAQNRAQVSRVGAAACHGERRLGGKD